MYAKTPAILGGTPAVTLDQAAAHRWPILTSEDEAAVLSVMRDGDISTHAVIRQLEADFCAYFGVRHALAHCNGTAALLAAFFALDLQPGDEILVPSATFWASVAPMLWVGAVPVFCESEEERLGLDPEDVARKITPRTRAIVVTHLWGMPAKMSHLLAIARQHNLTVIEDASHAQGAHWRGRPCGTLGDMAVFSLQGSKLAPAGEGGILLTDDEALMERALCLGDITRIIELESPAQRFAATSFGLKTRMAPLSAAIARVQLRHLAQRNARRNAHIEYLSHFLEERGFATFLPPPYIERVYFEYLVKYNPQNWGLSLEQLIAALSAEGCQVSLPRYPLLHQQPLFTEGHWVGIARLGDSTGPVYRADDLPRTTAAQENFLRLPTFSSANRELLDQYCEAFEKVRTNAAEIARSAAISDRSGSALALPA